MTLKYLMKTYEEEHTAFKLMISFGYVTEKPNENDEWVPKIYKPMHQYFHNEPQIIKDKKGIKNLISMISKEKIIEKLTKRFPDTKTRLLGVYSIGVKITRLDFPIGSNIKLPEYIS